MRLDGTSRFGPMFMEYLERDLEAEPALLIKSRLLQLFKFDIPINAYCDAMAAS